MWDFLPLNTFQIYVLFLIRAQGSVGRRVKGLNMPQIKLNSPKTNYS